ncbi:hypothetical protein PVAP13_5KG205735 [Panicum virgatum]|uniref:FRIGIDA-like protein n=1 Tax=Panicum virgatum TaxID=38727 RepID=A0A8T0SF86_PANVG|nr:hypothetical protein PVAP13_5KG205735 [Panicum virgatum]
MDSAAFMGFVVAHHKKADALRAEMPPALKFCVDPAVTTPPVGAPPMDVAPTGPSHPQPVLPQRA